MSITKDRDNVYLNVIMQGNLNKLLTQLEYDVTKSTAIIDKPDDYYLSILRFDVPLSTIPIIIFPVIPGSGTTQLSPFIFGISYNGVNYKHQVTYVSQVTNPHPVNQTDPTRQIVTVFYYVYSYKYVLKLFNQALEIAYNASPIAALFPGIPPPYFDINVDTGLISLIVHKLFVTLTAPLLEIPQIYISYNSTIYLDGFSYIFNSFNDPDGKDSIFNTSVLTNDDGHALYGTAPTNPPTYYILEQETYTLQYWNPLRKVLFVSNTIPVNNEFVPGYNNGSVNSTLPIITDFTPQIETANQSRSILYYNPYAQYRLVDLLSQSPLYKIDLKVFWEDIYGNINPMYITSRQQANVKIGFLKKSLYKND